MMFVLIYLYTYSNTDVILSSCHVYSRNYNVVLSRMKIIESYKDTNVGKEYALLSVVHMLLAAG